MAGKKINKIHRRLIKIWIYKNTRSLIRTFLRLFCPNTFYKKYRTEIKNRHIYGWYDPSHHMWYIGQSSEPPRRRKSSHLSAMRNLKNKSIIATILRARYPENMIHQVLWQGDCTKEYIDQKEDYCMRQYNSIWPNGFNAIYRHWHKGRLAVKTRTLMPTPYYTEYL